MKIEQAVGPLRNFANRLFRLVEEMAGSDPFLVRCGHYRAEIQGHAFLFLRLIGDRAKRNPKYSIHLYTRWDERMAGGSVVEKKNWFESHRSADLVARADRPEEIAVAEEFIRLAFRIHSSTLNACSGRRQRAERVGLS